MTQQATEPRRDGWKAELELEFRRVGRVTQLARDRHLGPLRVQRPFLEPNGTCQVYVIHPPGGVAGGDELSIEVSARPGARALLTSPGATKLYRTKDAPCTLRQSIHVASGARVEWLPQETIVFDGAHARSSTRVALAADAAFAGFEIVALGRPKSGERFERGSLRQSIELWLDERPLFIDRGHYLGGAGNLLSDHGLGGRPVFGLFLLFPASSEALDLAREVGNSAPPSEFAATLVDGVLSCRVLSPSTLRARALFHELWSLLRPRCFGEDPHPPRIWAT